MDGILSKLQAPENTDSSTLKAHDVQLTIQLGGCTPAPLERVDDIGSTIRMLFKIFKKPGEHQGPLTLSFQEECSYYNVVRRIIMGHQGDLSLEQQACALIAYARLIALLPKDVNSVVKKVLLEEGICNVSGESKGWKLAKILYELAEGDAANMACFLYLWGANILEHTTEESAGLAFPALKGLMEHLEWVGLTVADIMIIGPKAEWESFSYGFHWSLTFTSKTQDKEEQRDGEKKVDDNDLGTNQEEFEGYDCYDYDEESDGEWSNDVSNFNGYWPAAEA